MTHTEIILGAVVTVQDNGLHMVENAGPDPRVTGPCQLQASPFCTGEGIQRLDPMDMLDASTSFARHVSACLDCYEARADRYVKEVHAS